MDALYLKTRGRNELRVSATLLNSLEPKNSSSRGIKGWYTRNVQSYTTWTEKHCPSLINTTRVAL
jgi:hypothetical protein